MNNIAQYLDGSLGAVSTIPQSVFTPAVAHFNTAIARINASGTTTTPAPPPVYTGGGGSTKDGRDIILADGQIKADMRGLGGFIRGLFGLGALSQASVDQQVKETIAFATQFYNQIRSQYGDAGFSDPKVQEVITGVTAIIGTHYMGLDNKVHRVTQIISPDNAQTVLKPLLDQLAAMTDDSANTDEWKKEENTLFAKTAMYFHPDYAKYKVAFENEIFGRARHSKQAESWNFFYDGSADYIKAVIDLGAELIKTHPLLRPIYDAARSWRGEQTKFKIMDVLGPFALTKVFVGQILKNEKLYNFFDVANKVAFAAQGVALASAFVASGAAAGISAKLAGVVGKLSAAALVSTVTNATQQPPKQQQTPQQTYTPPPPAAAGFGDKVNQYLDDLVNLRPTTANIVSGIGFAAFIGLLLMGGNEQQKLNSKK